MKEPVQNRRECIVAVASVLFYQKGFNQTSIADIAAQVGITKGNLHYHFRSKDDLLEAIVEYRLAKMKQCLDQWEQDYLEPIDRLKRFVRMMSEEEAQLIQYGCAIGSLNVELGKDQPRLQTKSLKMFTLFQQWLEQCFTSMGLENSHALSLHMLSMTQGASLMSYVYHDGNLLQSECKAINEWIESLV